MTLSLTLFGAKVPILVYQTIITRYTSALCPGWFTALPPGGSLTGYKSAGRLAGDLCLADKMTGARGLLLCGVVVATIMGAAGETTSTLSSPAYCSGQTGP